MSFSKKSPAIFKMNKTIRQQLEESRIDDGLAERLAYLRWTAQNLPAEYRAPTDTRECLSIRDFYPASIENSMKKKAGLAIANKRVSDKLAHVFGQMCKRCLNEINNYAVFYADYHPEFLTEEAKAIISIEKNRLMRERLNMATMSYVGDTIHLLHLKSPEMGGDSGMQNTHLVYFDECSARHGQQRFTEMLDRSPVPKGFFRDLTNFGGVIQIGVRGVNERFYSTKSESFRKTSGGHSHTIIEIISGSDYVPQRRR